MSNEEVVRKFYTCYQNHDYLGMQSCLDEHVRFSDYGYDIEGKKVYAMWHWYCIPYGSRQEPIAVPFFEMAKSEGDGVTANYRVSYLLDERRVDYIIASHFTLKNEKIVEHKDTSTISEYEFARMAVGFPRCLLALTPLFHYGVKKEAAKKLQQFIDEHQDLYGNAVK